MGRTIRVRPGDPGFTIEPVHIAPENEYASPQTLLEAIQKRQQHLFHKRSEDYTRFQRFCAWLAFRCKDLKDWHITYLIFQICSGAATAAYLFMAILERMESGRLVLQFELPMLVKAALCSLPLVVYAAARWKTRDWNKSVLPAWLNAFHDRRQEEYRAIAHEADAFNAWAKTANIPLEMQTEVTTAADARRKAIHDRMLAYLGDMDKALAHRVQVERLVESRSVVDAAFPDANPRLTLALAPRVAVLKDADLLLEEAGKLGMPTEEILAVRERTRV